MKDIVERLRRVAEYDPMCAEALAEIERLRAELANIELVKRKAIGEATDYQRRAERAERDVATLRSGIKRSAERHDLRPSDWEIQTCWHNEAELLRNLLAKTEPQP